MHSSDPGLRGALAWLLFFPGCLACGLKPRLQTKDRFAVLFRLPMLRYIICRIAIVAAPMYAYVGRQFPSDGKAQSQACGGFGKAGAKGIEGVVLAIESHAQVRAEG